MAAACAARASGTTRRVSAACPPEAPPRQSARPLSREETPRFRRERGASNDGERRADRSGGGPGDASRRLTINSYTVTSRRRDDDEVSSGSTRSSRTARRATRARPRWKTRRGGPSDTREGNVFLFLALFASLFGGGGTARSSARPSRRRGRERRAKIEAARPSSCSWSSSLVGNSPRL